MQRGSSCIPYGMLQDFVSTAACPEPVKQSMFNETFCVHSYVHKKSFSLCVRLERKGYVMKQAYQKELDEVFDQMETDVKGLTMEAVRARVEKYGENVLQEGKKKTSVVIFLEQFKDLLVLILMVAAVISMISGNVESTIVIFVVIILNAILGTVQYMKAEKSLDSLKALSSPCARVIRDGEKMEIPSKDVVPGDVVVLEAGDMVVADGRIFNNYSLQVNESALTGESTNVDKIDYRIEEEVPLAERLNMVYSGTLVTYGRAEVLVTETGMNTEMGKIADLMNGAKDKKTPLQKSMDDFSKKLAMVIIGICVVVFALQIYQKTPVLDALMFAVALAVAAIPEALSSIITIVQAMGTQKMAAEGAIMKELKAVESLGCVSVICSDKTGTLTQNKMTVTSLYIDGEVITPEDMNLHKQSHRYLLYNAILNNDSSVQGEKQIGDPTEACLLTMARTAFRHTSVEVQEEDVRQMMPRLEELPFDSERKMMSTKYLVHGVHTVFTKGALDMLLPRITRILTEDGVMAITNEQRNAILRQNEEFSQNGLRVLTFVYKEVMEEERLCLEAEEDYIFIGLVAMMDPPREESIQAVADARSAGIRTVMITGDHKVTATAIAKQIGIWEDGDVAATGQELDAMPDEELDRVLSDIAVYARVSPENKIRIVEAWQRRGSVVAMTGDGVNDAPALKKADIGVAMGITGTEVSKDAAAMILSDDNFATIMKAVSNGRSVYRNIQNAIQFLLSGNMAGILTVLYCCMAALPAPFAPVHLLFINLLTDSLPALAIGMETTDKTLLKEQPRDTNEGIMTSNFVGHLFGYGFMIAVVTIVAFYVGMQEGKTYASTMAFATLTLTRLFHGFNCRSRKSLARLGVLSNPWSVGAFGIGVLLLVCVIGIPGLRQMFEVAVLTVPQIGAIMLLAMLPTICIQLTRVMLGK